MGWQGDTGAGCTQLFELGRERMLMLVLLVRLPGLMRSQSHIQLRLCSANYRHVVWHRSATVVLASSGRLHEVAPPGFVECQAMSNWG